MHERTWYKHKPLSPNYSSPFPWHSHYFSTIKTPDLCSNMAKKQQKFTFQRINSSTTENAVLLRWCSITTVLSHSVGAQATLIIVGKLCCSELAAGIWLWKDKSGEAEVVNFCVVGHFQLTQFDLQVIVVVLNKIMFAFPKWLGRESWFVLFFFSELKGFTTETYSYNANITQPEQRNKPPNTTTDLPQQTVVNRKPQQWEGESHGGLHGYTITKKSEHGNTMTTTNKQPRTRQAQEQTHRHTSPAEMMATACKQLHHL